MDSTLSNILGMPIGYSPLSSEDMKTLIERFNEKYSIEELIALLEELKPGTEQAWFAKVKEVFRDIIEEDFPKVFSRFLGVFNVGHCISLGFPRIFHMSKVCMIFLLETLEPLKIVRLSEMADKMGPETTALFQKIVSTVFAASLSLMNSNKANVLNLKPWVVVDISEEKAKEMNASIGEKMVDIGIWKEFMEFLETRSDVMRPPQEQCIIS